MKIEKIIFNSHLTESEFLYIKNKKNIKKNGWTIKRKSTFPT